MDYYSLMINGCDHQVAEKVADHLIGKGLMTLDGDSLYFTDKEWSPEDVMTLMENDEEFAG